MKTCLPLFLALTIAALGCKSKPDKQREDNTYAVVVGPPQEIPADWPMTREQYLLIGYNAYERALDSKALELAGLHSRKEIVEFAYEVLKMDLSPIERDMIESSGRAAQRGAYTLLSYYGSIEDAQKLFDAVKAIDGKVVDQNLDGQHTVYIKMVEALGYFLMRDHFMPQRERTLMQEIDDYLYQCSEISRDSCWDYEGRPEAIGSLMLAAIDGIERSCSDRVKARAKAQTAYPEGSITHQFGKSALEEIARIEDLADKIRKQLPPVLSESEIDR